MLANLNIPWELLGGQQTGASVGTMAKRIHYQDRTARTETFNDPEGEYEAGSAS